MKKFNIQQKGIYCGVKKGIGKFTRIFSITLFGAVTLALCMELLLQGTVFIGTRFGITDESPLSFMLIWGVASLFLVVIFAGLWFLFMKVVWRALFTFSLKNKKGEA